MMESGGWKELEATVLQNIESVKIKRYRRRKRVEPSHAFSVGRRHNYVFLQNCDGGPQAPPEILQICGCSVADPVGQTTSLPIQRKRGQFLL